MRKWTVERFSLPPVKVEADAFVSVYGLGRHLGADPTGIVMLNGVVDGKPVVVALGDGESRVTEVSS